MFNSSTGALSLLADHCWQRQTSLKDVEAHSSCTSSGSCCLPESRRKAAVPCFCQLPSPVGYHHKRFASLTPRLKTVPWPVLGSHAKCIQMFCVGTSQKPPPEVYRSSSDMFARRCFSQTCFGGKTWKTKSCQNTLRSAS